MSDDKPAVDDLLYKPRPVLREQYGQFGVDVTPAVLTHSRVVGVLATLDQEGTGETYDPNDKLWYQLHAVKNRIEDDLYGAIQDEYDD